MKKSSILTYGVLFILATFVVSPGTSIFAQTNFVKYAGNPVLPLGNAGEWDYGKAFIAGIVTDSSKLHLWYSGSSTLNQFLDLKIGYASSFDGIHWDKNENNPVFFPGSEKEFDFPAVAIQHVLFKNNLFKMWYVGGNFNAYYDTKIGYATSPDGIIWHKHEANPVLVKGQNLEWDNATVTTPIVLQNDSLYQMWYMGRNTARSWKVGYATSVDGVEWEKYPGNPVFSEGEEDSWEDVTAASSSILYENGTYYLFYHGRKNTGPFLDIDIGLATSEDGINWTRHPSNPILTHGGPQDWDGENAWFARVVKDGHRWRMWYSGRNSNFIDQLGYAEDFSNAAHVDSVRVPSEPIIAGSETANLWAYISNPHDDDLTVRAIIKSEEKNINTFVNMSYFGDGRWYGSWAVPAAVTDYVVGIELTNHSENYIHNSFDWGVFDIFRSAANPDPLSYTFTQIANIDDGENGRANEVIVTADGAILLANGQDGLRAYTFDGTSFVNIAHVNDGGDAMGVAEGSDGTIFLANGENGLRAYSFDGTAFTNLAHIDEGGIAMDVALADDGTVFLANGQDGLRTYSIDGSSFVSTAHYNDFSTEGEARGIAVAPDNTIFLFRDGVWVYNYTGSDFINIWHNSEIGNAKGIAFGTDGTIFLGYGRHIHAFSHENTSFVHVASDSIHDLWTHGITTADETIFIAGRSSVINGGVLAACSFDGSTFHKTAYLGVDSRDIALWSDDTLLVASGNAGLVAYTYSSISATSINDRLIKSPERYRLFQNYPNPFNPATIINYELPIAGYVELKIYNVMGQEVRTLVNSMKPAGTQQVVWNGRNNNGKVVPSGVYFYQFQAGSVVETRKMLLIR